MTQPTTASGSTGGNIVVVPASLTPAQVLAQYGVTVADNPITEEYDLIGANVEQRGEVGIVVTVYDENNNPAIGAVDVVNIFPDGHGDDPRKPDSTGTVRFSGNANMAYTPPARGPFTISLAVNAVKGDDKVIRFDKIVSPSVQGLGDYLAQHTLWQLLFKKRGAVVTPPPVDPPPSDIPVIFNDNALRALCYTRAWERVSFNPDAALVKFAREKNLGVATASEGRFFGPGSTVKYAYQPFTLGIVVCGEGDWGNCKVVSW